MQGFESNNPGLCMMKRRSTGAFKKQKQTKKKNKKKKKNKGKSKKNQSKTNQSKVNSSIKYNGELCEH